MEGAVRSDSRHIAELCYKICVALECADKVTEALSYGLRAVSVCEICLHKLKNIIATLSNDCEASLFSNRVISYSKEMGVVTQLLIDYTQFLLQQSMGCNRVPKVEKLISAKFRTYRTYNAKFRNTYQFDSV